MSPRSQRNCHCCQGNSKVSPFSDPAPTLHSAHLPHFEMISLWEHVRVSILNKQCLDQMTHVLMKIIQSDPEFEIENKEGCI
jgi:hypothetical protein